MEDLKASDVMIALRRLRLSHRKKTDVKDVIMNVNILFFCNSDGAPSMFYPTLFLRYVRGLEWREGYSLGPHELDGL